MIKMNNPVTKDLIIDENGRLIYITTDEMGDLALVIDASSGTLLDWGPDDATSRKYAQTKKHTCKSRQDIGDECPEPLTIHLLATTTTPYERCYAVKRARAGDTEFIKTMKRLYGEPEFHDWLQGEMALLSARLFTPKTSRNYVQTVSIVLLVTILAPLLSLVDAHPYQYHHTND